MFDATPRWGIQQIPTDATIERIIVPGHMFDYDLEFNTNVVLAALADGVKEITVAEAMSLFDDMNYCKLPDGAYYIMTWKGQIVSPLFDTEDSNIIGLVSNERYFVDAKSLLCIAYDQSQTVIDYRLAHPDE